MKSRRRLELLQATQCKDYHIRTLDVRFGSKADMSTTTAYVRFTPSSDSKRVKLDVRYGPKADIRLQHLKNI